MTSEEDKSTWLLPASKMDKETQYRFASQVERRRFEPGEVIIEEGDEADSFYVITQGSVDITQERSYRASQPIATLSKGDYFGEIGLVEGVQRTATVIACTDGPVEVLVMDRETFSDFFHASELTEEDIATVIRQRILTLQLAKALPMLTSEEVKHVSPKFQTLSYSPGELIIKQGDPADRFYIIVSGRCEVIDHQLDGRDVTVDYREPGEFFGEIGLLQNKPRTATVRAAVDSEVEVMALDREAFLAMTGDSKATEMTIAREMIQRMISLADAQES